MSRWTFQCTTLPRTHVRTLWKRPILRSAWMPVQTIMACLCSMIVVGLAVAKYLRLHESLSWLLLPCMCQPDHFFHLNVPSAACMATSGSSLHWWEPLQNSFSVFQSYHRPLWPRSLGLGPSHYYKKRQVCKRVSTSKIRHCFFPTQNPLWETNVVSNWPEKCKV